MNCKFGAGVVHIKWYQGKRSNWRSLGLIKLRYKIRHNWWMDMQTVVSSIYWELSQWKVNVTRSTYRIPG